jgi:hypothetical protein
MRRSTGMVVAMTSAMLSLPLQSSCGGASSCVAPLVLVEPSENLHAGEHVRVTLERVTCGDEQLFVDNVALGLAGWHGPDSIPESGPSDIAVEEWTEIPIPPPSGGAEATLPASLPTGDYIAFVPGNPNVVSVPFHVDMPSE